MIDGVYVLARWSVGTSSQEVVHLVLCEVSGTLACGQLRRRGCQAHGWCKECLAVWDRVEQESRVES